MRVKRRRSPSSRSRARWARGAELGPVTLEHRDGGRQGGEGRPQLVAHVGGEPGLAFDAVLEVGGHPVEGRGQLLEVGVVAGVHPGVELAAGDGHGGVGQAGEGPERPRAGPPADGGAGQGRDEGRPGQGEGQGPQGAGQLVEGEDLEVGGVHGGQRDPDHQLGGPGQVEQLGGRRARQDQGPLGRRGWRSGPTEIDVAYHWPPVRSTDRDPGRVSTDSMSWVTSVVGERRAFWTSAALAKAWRCSADWRSLRKVWPGR